MNPKLAIALIAITLPLAGCGNKGPLVLAQPPAPVETQETAPGKVPVEIAPDLEGEELFFDPDAPELDVDEPAADDEDSPDDDAGG